MVTLVNNNCAFICDLKSFSFRISPVMFGSGDGGFPSNDE